MKKNNIKAIILATILCLIVGGGFSAVPSYAASSVVIGHAATGENGLKNNKAGDQTGHEVYTMAWVYSSSSSSSRHWTVVARCKNAEKAKKIAQIIKDACDNDHVGYDQATSEQRNSFYRELKAANWDASKITKDCETTCTPMIAAAITAVGYNIGGTDQSASSLYKALKKQTDFEVFTSSDYVASDKKLLAGDILLSTGSHQHGAVVVSSPKSRETNAVEKTSASVTGKSSLGYKKGKNYITTVDIYIRCGPSTDYARKVLSELTKDAQAHAYVEGGYAILNKGTEVTALDLNGYWVRIPSGWICGGTSQKKYLEEVKGETSNGEGASESTGTVKPTETSKTTETTKASTTSTTSTKTSSTTSSVKLKVGKGYKLKVALYVRKGPGTNYAILKRSKLTAGAKKHAYSSSKARLKKGTVVTCQKLSKDKKWMKIPSGWICCKPGNVAAKK